MIIDKVRSYYRRHGILRLLGTVISRISSMVFLHLRLNFYCVSSVPSRDIKPACPIDIRKGSLEDIELIADFAGGEDLRNAPDRTRYFLNNGGEIFLAFSEGKLAHIARLCHYPGIINLNPLEIHPLVRIEKDEVFIGFCQTSPDFRGMNIYPAVLQYIIKYAFERNYKRCFISTSSTSTASIRGIEKAGFLPVGHVHKYKVLGKMFDRSWSSSSVGLNSDLTVI